MPKYNAGDTIQRVKDPSITDYIQSRYDMRYKLQTIGMIDVKELDDATEWQLVVEVEKFVKSDQGKLRYDLLPFSAVDSVVEVLTYGANRNPEHETAWIDNSTPKDIKRWEAAMLRHMSEVRQGRDTDDESGLKHMAHIATTALFILALEKGFEDV